MKPMSLATGTRLGAYEILGLIGAGGMGEVYKARDTRLERIVAIKVLPEHLSQNRERRERFEREARAVSSLNHPRICTLYDVGHDEGIDFIVMEFIEGETLAARLEKGPLSVEEALEIGAGIADGLDNAHRQGVVHRDLKPGNVMLTVPGVKILDFGLAKFATSDPIQNVSALSGLSGLPTQAKPLTTEGSIIGTLHYMAPEQLEGHEVDARSDIFAFGALLYEMVTGRKAFEGKSQASLISAIMSSDPPPVSQLQALSPPALDHVVRTCLAKNPNERWQTSGDVFRQLKWIREGGSQPSVAAPVGAARSSILIWASIAAALALGAIVGAFAWSLRPDAPARIVRFVATPPSAAPLDTASPDGDLAITPDGTRIVYAALHEGRRQLVVRALHELEAATLAGLGEGLRAPFISPDGNWVGYFNDRLLRRVSILGGPPVTICTLPGGSSRGASWGRDGTIVFATGALSGLWRVPAGGGEPEEITLTGAAYENHVLPEILPGGEAVLFTVTREAVGNVENNQIAVASLVDGEPRILIPGGSNPCYASSGHIIYGVNGTLRAVGFDLARLEVTSAPAPVLSGVVTKAGGATNFGISDDGSLVYVAGRMGGGAQRVLVWIDRNGREEVLTAEPRAYTSPRISPDGSRLALDVRDQESDVWIWDFARETLSRFTFGPSVDGRPVWSPDV